MFESASNAQGVAPVQLLLTALPASTSPAQEPGTSVGPVKMIGAVAVTRPRLRNDGPSPPLELSLRRGAAVLAVAVDADGWLRLAADALAPLNLGAVDAPLVLVVRSPSAGQVLVRALQIDLPPQSSSWSFTNPP